MNKHGPNGKAVNIHVFVSSGSTANTLLLDAVHENHFSRSQKLKIHSPAINWATNISTFRQQGHDLFFYDIDYKTYSPTVESIRKYKEMGFEPDIVFVTHIMGIAADLSPRHWGQSAAAGVVFVRPTRSVTIRKRLENSWFTVAMKP